VSSPADASIVVLQAPVAPKQEKGLLHFDYTPDEVAKQLDATRGAGEPQLGLAGA
jgi:hypothetical protein